MRLMHSLLCGLSDALFPPRDTELVVRSFHDEALAELLAPQAIPLSTSVSALPPAIALLPYADARVRACIVEAKFHGNGRAAQLLARALRKHLVTLLTAAPPHSIPSFIIIPIPLSRKRQRERGYNQVERIVQVALSGLGTPYIGISTDVLTRERNTVPQTSLSGAERRQNLKGAFAIGNTPDPGHTYILLDDVITTGSTLAVAAAELYKGGARHILPLGLTLQERR